MSPSEAVAQSNVIECPRATEPNAPLITYALFAYNQESSVRAAIESALAQTWNNLEIILSDDCSTDNTFNIMKNIHDDYHGSHKVILNQNPFNLGIARHVNALMQLAHGELIVAAAGDDLSDPLRTARLVETWAGSGFATGVFHSGFNIIDSNGLVTRSVTRPAVIRPNVDHLIFSNVVKGATQAWSRGIFDFFGPLSASLCQEDMNITIRGAMLGGVHYAPEPLVNWRTGGVSNNASTSQRAARRRNSVWYIGDMAQAILDFHTALRKNVINESRYNELVTKACDRLMFEALLQNRGVASFVRSCLFDMLRAGRRVMGAIYKSALLSGRSRAETRSR